MSDVHTGACHRLSRREKVTLMPGPNLAITIGSTSYSFPIAGPVTVRLKPPTGETFRQTGTLQRSDQLDAPRSRSTLTGIGVSRIVSDDILPNAALRAFETLGMDAWPGVVCLGPLGQTTTDIALARQVVGFAEGISKLFYFSENTTAARENICYFVGSTATWTNATATADWEGTAGLNVDGFPCRAMWEHNDAGTSKMYALRRTAISGGAGGGSGGQYQLMSSTNGTTWVPLSHGAYGAVIPPSGEVFSGDDTDGTVQVYGGIDIDGTSYTTSYSGTTVTLRQATGTLATWTASSGGTLTSNAAPIALVKWTNASGTIMPFVMTQEGIYRYTGSAMVQVLSWGIRDTNNGKFPVVWQPSDLDTDFLIVANGQTLWALYWDSNARLQAKRIDPSYRTQGLPKTRRGRILALAVSGQFLWAWIGGETLSGATSTGGWYKTAYPSPDSWIGPVYIASDITRIARAAIFSGADDNTARLHFSVDNGTASDTDQVFFANIDSDPRTVPTYLHAPGPGSIVYPKDDLGLPEMTGTFRKVEATGTNFSSSNKISEIYASADAIPLGGEDSGWGSTLGSIIASGGTVNFTATPSGTGQSARALQVKFLVTGTSNASPYIEMFNIYVKKQPADKRIYTFPIDLGARGTTGNRSVLLANLDAVLAATTDLSATWGGRAATVMECYKLGGQAVQYVDETGKAGTVNSLANPQQVLLTLVEV